MERQPSILVSESSELSSFPCPKAPPSFPGGLLECYVKLNFIERICPHDLRSVEEMNRAWAGCTCLRFCGNCLKEPATELEFPICRWDNCFRTQCDIFCGLNADRFAIQKPIDQHFPFASTCAWVTSFSSMTTYSSFLKMLTLMNQ